MATKVDVSNLTINAEEASAIAEAIIEGELINGDLAQLHDIQTGIEHKKQIVFVGHIGDSLKKAAGCAPQEGGVVEMSEKFWDPEIFDTRFTHCADDMNKLLKLFKKAQRINPDFYDRVNSDEIGLLTSLIGMMLREAIQNKIWFSDKVAAIGPFSAGTDLDLYNVIDGLWKQIFAEINAGDDNYIEIASNAQASQALQYSDFTPAKANQLLIDMRNNADDRLLEDSGAQYYVTRFIADRFRDLLRDKTLNSGLLEITENGKRVLTFDGYKINIMHAWDRTIKSTFNDGTVLDLPHRALFTTPENLPIGTLSVDDFENLESFYDKVTKKNYVDVALSLDAKFGQSYMAVAAY